MTSTSRSMQLNLKELALEALKEFKLNGNNLVIDIGGNDGTLLSNFKKSGVKTLNIEPATNIALLSEKKGINTINKFVSVDTANEIVKKYGKAKIVTATNVFAHINNLNEFLESLDVMLQEDGIFIFEVPYLIDLLEKTAFDTIYHEHLSYFSVKPLCTLFDKFSMCLFRVKRMAIHSGSIRVFVSKTPREVEKSVTELLKLEEKHKLNSLDPYFGLKRKVEKTKLELISLLRDLKSQGKDIVGYGAAAKGNTLLNYCKIGAEYLDYIIDNTPFKQGLYSPGMHLPIKPPSAFLRHKPDYALILAWNWAKEIMNKEKEYKSLGGKFILPLPKPTIID
ncbi:MAG: class I SAM-dependent methyltransferase [Candidatus Thorarchaeota archaeon]